MRWSPRHSSRLCNRYPFDALNPRERCTCGLLPDQTRLLGDLIDRAVLAFDVRREINQSCRGFILQPPASSPPAAFFVLDKSGEACDRPFPASCLSRHSHIRLHQTSESSLLIQA
jgi:hypothetical protein